MAEIGRTINPFGTLVEYITITAKRQVKSVSVWKDNAERNILGLCCYVREEVCQET